MTQYMLKSLYLHCGPCNQKQSEEQQKREKLFSHFFTAEYLLTLLHQITENLWGFHVRIFISSTSTL